MKEPRVVYFSVALALLAVSAFSVAPDTRPTVKPLPGPDAEPLPPPNPTVSYKDIQGKERKRKRA